MKLKSRGIFKNLSAMFLLLIVVTAICVPLKEVNAVSLSWPSIPSIGDLISFDIFSIIIEFIADAAADEDTFLWPIYFLAYQFFNICLLCVTILVYFGAWLVDVFLDEDIYVRVLDMTDKTSAVYIGWTTVRDACNTFFILFLLLIAFSTILRIQAYNAKNLLPKLIISLFLINFSATIAMMVIDLGQVFMFEIKTWMGAGFSEGGKPLTSIIDYFNSEYNFGSPTGKYNLGDVVGVAFAVAYSVILGLLYIMLALFLMVRIVVFVILVIISPFAFFSIILPGMRTYTSQWWSSLVSHAIFGPIFLFFIFLSGKMAQSMKTFKPIAANDEISSLSYIIAELIPHVVALALLAAAIPVTQKLGAAGSSKIIGGAAGMGKVAVGTYAGIKLAGGLGKKTGGLTVGRAHSALKGRSKWYNEGAQKVGGVLKSAPIGGRIFIKHESDKAERNKEAVAKHEKVMDNLTDKDKKKYVDSFKLDKNAQAEAQQAMFSLMAKDSGKGLTNERLRKMGYEKEVEGKKVFDEKRFDKDFGRAVAHGMDTTNIETYRPDLIKDKEDRMDRVRKTVADGDEKKIKLDVLADEDIEKELKESMDKQRYHSFINSKPQEERDGLVEIKKQQLAVMHDSDGAVRKGREGEVLEQRREIFNLSGSKDKLNALNDIEIEDGEVKLTGPVDIEFSRSAVKGMNADELINQDPEFLEKTGHMVDPLQIGRIKRNKYTTPEQTEAIEKSVRIRMKKDDVDETEYENLKKSLSALESSVTRPTSKKSDKETKETKAEEPGKKWEEKMKEKTGGGGSRGSGSGESSKKNKRSFLGDESGEANLTSAIPKKTKKEKEGGGKAKKDRGSRAAIIDDADTNKPRRSFWKDESAEAGLTGGVKSKTTIDKKAETKPRSEKTGVKKAVDSYKDFADKSPSIVAGKHIKEKVIDPAIETYKEKAPPVIIATDKVIGKALDVASVDKRVAAANIVLKPIIKEEIKVNEERARGIEVSKKEEVERKLKRVGRKLKPTVSKDADKVVEVAGDGAGAALKEIEKRGGKVGAAAKVIRPIVESKYVQEKVSKEVRKKVDDKEDKKPEVKKGSVETVEQAKSKDASKQWKIKETEEKITETRESVSKDGLKNSVVKSEIIFDPTKMSEERAKQIKEAMRGMSNDMKQEITNNIAVDSSQEAVDIDLEKLVNPKEIAKLVEEGINTKDVEKTLKDVKKSFNKFKENNNESASTTVFGAGISVARAALNEAQNREDHKKQAVELATIENVLGEIKSGMKKQDKPSGEGEK